MRHKKAVLLDEKRDISQFNHFCPNIVDTFIPSPLGRTEYPWKSRPPERTKPDRHDMLNKTRRIFQDKNPKLIIVASVILVNLEWIQSPRGLHRERRLFKGEMGFTQLALVWPSTWCNCKQTSTSSPQNMTNMHIYNRIHGATVRMDLNQ